MRSYIFVLFFSLTATFVCHASICDSVYTFLPTSEDLALARALVSILTGSDYHREFFGSEYADNATQETVREIMVSMGFAPDRCIHVLYLNAQGLKQFGPENLIATTNTIFIDKAWFHSLTQDEQRFLLSHELAHIYSQDARRMSLIALLASIGVGYNMYHYLNDQESLTMFGVFVAFCLLVVPAYGRYQEQRADARGAKALGSKIGGIRCFNRWIAEHTPDQYNSLLEQFYEDMIATHPSSQCRLAALEALEIT